MKKILLLIVTTFLLGGCNREDNHQPLTSHKLYFTKADSIAQSFVAHRDKLNIVAICLRNPSRSLIPLEFMLTDDHGQIIRRLAFSGGNIDNTDCTKFQFEPVDGSAGKSYIASIVTKLDPGLESVEVATLRLGLYAEAHGGGDYKEGMALVDAKATEYDLHFKTSFQQDARSIVKESVTSLFSRLGQDPLFMIIYTLLIVMVVIKLRRAE